MLFFPLVVIAAAWELCRPSGHPEELQGSTEQQPSNFGPEVHT